MFSWKSVPYKQALFASSYGLAPSSVGSRLLLATASVYHGSFMSRYEYISQNYKFPWRISFTIVKCYISPSRSRMYIIFNHKYKKAAKKLLSSFIDTAI